MSCLKNLDKKHGGFFAAGVLFGTAGIKVLTSRDAKGLYAAVTAALLRARDAVMKTATDIQENAEDIYAEAVAINEFRNVEETYDDSSIQAEDGEAQEAEAARKAEEADHVE